MFYNVNTRDENIREEVVDTMDNSHPILQSACWYLDFNWDIDKYLNSDMLKGTILKSPAKFLLHHIVQVHRNLSCLIRIYTTSSTSPVSNDRDVSNRVYDGKILGGEGSMDRTS